MATDWASRISVPETGTNLHRGTNPAVLWSPQSHHSPQGHDWICNFGVSESVWRFRNTQTGHFQLPDVHFTGIELQQWWTGAIGHDGNSKTVPTLPRTGQSQGFVSVRPYQCWVFPDIQSALQKTCQVVWVTFGLWHSHWTSGRQQWPGR